MSDNGKFPVSFVPSRFNRGERNGFVANVTKLAPSSDLYASNVLVKNAADTMVATTSDLEAKEEALDLLKKQVVNLEETRDTLIAQYDKDATAFKSIVEAKAKTLQDMLDVGFDPKAVAPKPPVSGEIESVECKMGGDKGTASARVKKLQGAWTYDGQIATDPAPGAAPQFEDLVGNGILRHLHGLVSGARYWVRFRAKNAKTTGPWTEPTLLIAR